MLCSAVIVVIKKGIDVGKNYADVLQRFLIHHLIETGFIQMPGTGKTSS